MLETPAVVANVTEVSVTAVATTESVNGLDVTPAATAVKFEDPIATPVARPVPLIVTTAVVAEFQLDTECP